MNIGYLTYQIHEWWQQVQALQRRPHVSSTEQDQRDPLLENAFEALSTAWEELCMATENLRQQHEEVAATRQAVEAEHQRHQELFDLAPDGYLVTDLSGSIREANHAAGTLLNMRQDHLVGKPLVVLIAKGDRKQFWTQLTRLQEGKRIQEWQVRVQPRGRPSISVAFTAAPAHDGQGGLIGFRWLFRDITARKQLEEQLTQAQEMEAVGRLASGMVHEFSRQPKGRAREQG
jgi:PAS domain S-box-containing protein